MRQRTDISKIPAALRRGATVGLLVALLLIGFDVTRFLSRSSIMENIQLNMPEAQVWDILRSNEIECPDAWISYRCTFDDYWRSYTVTFSNSDPAHRANRKIVSYKTHKNSAVSKTLAFLHLI